MLSDTLAVRRDFVAEGWSWVLKECPPLSGAIAGLSLLIVRRIWRFEIMPRYYLDDPNELPYWVPILGHGIAFFNNSNALLSRAKAHFNHVQDPYALTAANSLTYVITKPQDVAEAYCNTTTLSFNEFAQAIMRGCGCSESCVQAMYTDLPKEKARFPNPHGKPLGTLARQMHIHQLHNDGKDQVVLPLLQWCSDFFSRAGQRVYFGPELEKLDDSLPRTFIAFNELSWQILYQYPDFLAGKMKSSRDAIQRVLKQYFRIPQEKRHGDAWFTKVMEDEMRALLGVCLRLRLINTNARKAAFWLLTYILHHSPDYLNLIRSETLPAFPSGPCTAPQDINLTHLHEHCPTLDAMWNETIRLSAYSASVRFLAADTPVGNKTLRKGNRLMVPYRQLHFDASIFGTEYPVTEFVLERFMSKS
ncbi:cytochrome P450 [Aspergillus aurantiobrunneus]